ncbi:Inositol-tetrakisphosphate 1-kinase [Phytophthora cinnamomi]|uniref:Inositol-tetrakisphosphate 1-kinase n=1 Tax=Phytophthora cinnamomi TaxID=4785 RepID=UPI00355AAD8B|nr:Inositol-tetrakisphosphate 1-kinase [Phytophthora cinnamomi]
MDGSFDGIDGPQHERVAKALEQVNGFRYRYHPPPQDDKKMLRFDSDDEEDLSDGEGDEDEISGDETQRHQRRRSSNEKAKHKNGNPDVPIMTLDDHIEKLLRTTRTLAMLKIANNTAGTIPSDSEDDSDEADDVVSDELSIGSLSSVGSPKHGASSGKLTSLGSLSLAGTPKHGASSGKLSSLGSNSSMGGRKSSLLGTAAMRLARTLSAFLCLPRAISYVDLEAITEKLLESPNDQFDDGEYADLIDCHVDSARDDEAHTETDEDDPIWKRRNSRPIRPLNLAEDPTDLELHQRQIFTEANHFGGVSSRNFFLASSKHLLTKDDSKGSMYFGVSLSGRLLGSTMNGSSTSLNFGRQGSGSTVASNPSIDEAAADIADSPFNEEEYVKWRTQVKDDYLAWLNAKVEARKRRKSRMKKVDPSKKPRWLLLYEASKNPTQKYRPDEKE